MDKRARLRGPITQNDKITLLNVHSSLQHDFSKLNKTQLLQKTADYTGCSITTVKRVLREKEATGAVSPKNKAESQPLIVLDEHQKWLIGRTVHGFFFANKPLTLIAVHAKIKENAEIPKMSQIKLYYVLKELNFEWIKRHRKSMLIDREDIVAWRRKYLREIKKIREENKPIFYLDEKWVNAGHTTSKIWVDMSVTSARQAFNEGLSLGLKKPSGKGRRLIVLHIGSENRFVDNSLLLFEGVKTGDYHEEMNAAKFEDWFKKILLRLPPNSVIVMNNASYHTRKLEPCPTSAWRKDDIKKWLSANKIEFDPSMVKMELLQLVRENKPFYTKYVVDELALAYNQRVLRLPPYHCEFNPIELIWAQIKGQVAKNNTTFKFSKMRPLFETAVSNVTPMNWKACVEHTKKEEAKMWKLDGLMDTVVDELIITLGESSEDSDCSELFASDKENE